MRKDVVFIKDFATKKKGEEWLGIDGFLAHRLINLVKVAVLKKDYKPEPKPSKKTAKQTK